MHRRELVALLAALGGSRARILAASQADPTAGWRVNGDRVNTWLTELSAFGRHPEGGVSRLGFTDADLEGRAHVRALMEAAGLDVAVDPAGNLIGRLDGSTPGALPLLFGSHIDSVPRGGNYDGTVGSLAAIEVIRTLRERGYRNRHPLWVTVWCDEESGLTGSRGFIGQLSAQELARPYREGRTLAECIARIGGHRSAWAATDTPPGASPGIWSSTSSRVGTWSGMAPRSAWSRESSESGAGT